ncbi:hypothetical protein TNCV_4009491 [Trichonephila clavipes]|nr:hypothetical protein TNCV_4009491 [Trichonephila clavipes]
MPSSVTKSPHVAAQCDVKIHSQTDQRTPLHVISIEAQTSYRWCGVEVRRGGASFRCRPRHLTMVQNDDDRRQQLSCCFKPHSHQGSRRLALRLHLGRSLISSTLTALV